MRRSRREQPGRGRAGLGYHRSGRRRKLPEALDSDHDSGGGVLSCAAGFRTSDYCRSLGRSERLKLGHPLPRPGYPGAAAQEAPTGIFNRVTPLKTVPGAGPDHGLNLHYLQTSGPAAGLRPAPRARATRGHRRDPSRRRRRRGGRDSTNARGR